MEKLLRVSIATNVINQAWLWVCAEQYVSPCTNICNVFSTVIMVAESLVTGYGFLYGRPKIEISPSMSNMVVGIAWGSPFRTTLLPRTSLHCDLKWLLFGQTSYVVRFDCTCLAVVVPTCYSIYLAAHPVLGVSCECLVPWWVYKHSKTNMKKNAVVYNAGLSTPTALA